MATRLTDPKVGDTVYRGYQPNQPGIVVEVLEPVAWDRPEWGVRSRPVRVRWLDGTVAKESNFPSLSSFDSLIEDHQRKALKFEAVRARLRGAGSREEAV